MVPQNYREALDWIKEFISLFNEMTEKADLKVGCKFWKGHEIYSDRASLVFYPKKLGEKPRRLSRKDFDILIKAFDDATTPTEFDTQTRERAKRDMIFSPEEIEALEEHFKRYEIARKFLDARSNPNIVSLSSNVLRCCDSLEKLVFDNNKQISSLSDLEGFVEFLDEVVTKLRANGRYRESVKAAHVINTVLRVKPDYIGLPSSKISTARMNALIRGARSAFQGDLTQSADAMLMEMSTFKNEFPNTVLLRTLTHQGYKKGTKTPFLVIATVDQGVKEELYGYATAASGSLHNGAGRAREMGCSMHERSLELGNRTPDQAWLEDFQQCERECDPESAAFTSGRWAEELAWDGQIESAFRRLEISKTMIESSGLELSVASRRLERARGIVTLAEYKFSRNPIHLIAAVEILKPLIEYFKKMGHKDTVDEISEAFARAIG